MAHTKVTKAHSANTGAANTYSYSGSFDTFKATEVVVTLDSVALTYTASTINESASPREYTVDYTNKTIHIGGADLSSGTIVIKPVTDMGAPTPRATYTPGASITSEDLNNNQKQLLRKAMEYDEQKLSSTGGTMTGSLTLGEDTTIIFEGATDDAYETTLTVTDPTADRTITIPNVSGTVVTTGDTATVTATMMAADSVDSSELVDGSIDTSHIANLQVTTGKIAADAVTSAKIADDAIDSEHYTDGSIDTAHIAAAQVTTAKLADDAVTTAKITDGNVTTVKIAADAITAAKIADDVINSEHYVAASIDTEHIADSQVTTAKIAADAVTGAKIADDAIDSEHYTDGSIDTAHIGADQVTTAKIANANVTTAKIASDAVTGAKIADDTIDSEHYVDGSIDLAHMSANSVDSDQYVDGSIDLAHMSANSVDSDQYVDGSIDNEHLADDAVGADELAANAVVNASVASGAAIAHSKLAALTDTQILVGNGSNVPTGVAVSGDVTIANTGAVTIANNAVEIGMIGCEQTTISDSDSHIPTSGAVVDYVAAQIAPIGGLEVIATDAAFPNTQPASGVVISIADAGGLTVSDQGVTTQARTVGGSTVTINNINSSFHDTVIDNGIGMLVTSSGSSQLYHYHKTVIKEADVAQISDDINDFNSKYRIASSAPGSDNDEGDLYFNTSTNKMNVYDGSAWGEVTSTGDYKLLGIKDNGQAHNGTGPTFNGSNDQYDLFDGSSDASINSAGQLLVVLNGVLQKPNASYDAAGEGFALDGADGIRFCDPPASGSVLFVTQIGTATTVNVPADGSVVAAKIGSGAVTTAKIGADAVDGTKIADDAIGAEHIADNAVGLAAMAGGTDGVIITYDASGNPVHVGPGTDGQVLTSTGAGSPPAFEAVPTLTGSTNNTVVTVTGANAMTGEANLVFDGTHLGVGTSSAAVVSGGPGLVVHGTTAPRIRLTNATTGEAGTDGSELSIDGTTKDFWIENREDAEVRFATNGAERFVLENDGDVTIKDGDLVIGTSGHGIDFAATAGPTAGTGSSELFDDYEEGSWTPVLTGDTQGTYTMNGGNGNYIKIGDAVTASCTLSWSGQTTAYGGACQLEGLPFTNGSTRVGVSLGPHTSGISAPTGFNVLSAVMDPNQIFIYLTASDGENGGYTHTPTVGTSGAIYGVTVAYIRN